MPELPEVETIRRGLGKFILNKKIVQIKILEGKSFVCKDDGFLKQGRMVTKLRRFGKALVIDLEGRFLITGPYCCTIGVNCSAACNTFWVLFSILLSESGLVKFSRMPPPLLLEELVVAALAGAYKFGGAAFGCLDLPRSLAKIPSFLGIC